MEILLSVKSLSLILLFTGIGLAFSQIRLADWILGWILLSGALLLQGFRSMLSYVAEHGGVDANTYTAANDWMGLGFSLLVVAAMHMMREVFSRHKLTAESLRVFSTASSDAIIAVDSAEKITIWNPAAGRIFGYEEAEAMTMRLGEMIVRNGVHAEAGRVAARGYDDKQGPAHNDPSGPVKGLRKDGTAIVVECSSSKVMVGRQVHAILMIRDISARSRAEEALRAQEERFRVLFDRASDGILILSPSGALLAVNESFARMHGYSAKEMLAINLRDLDTPETRKLILERMQRILSGEAMTFEVEHYHRDGHTFPLEVSSSLIFSEGVPLIQAFHRDITERNRQRHLITEHNALLTRQKTELESTLRRIKRLEGLISICMYCKKMRSEDNVWQQLEQYIGEHSDAVFSHGICPECLDKKMKELK